VKEDHVQVSVTDNGPGIAPGTETAIFDKFTRGAKESPTPGVGLGLAVSKAIIEAHRGKIWAEPVAGGGARFVFTLPLGNPPAVDLAAVEARAVNANAPSLDDHGQS
jgi:two-component system sensor histidine kinase KdpD